MLEAVCDDLRKPQTADQQARKSHGLGPADAQDAAAGLHGVARMGSNFGIEQLAAEYRALRASVLRLWSQDNDVAASTDLQDMTRFNEAIDQLLMASVTSFAGKAREAVETERRNRDEFLAMLAHELRNPLAPLRTAARLLKMGHGDRSVAGKTSAIIERQVGHMSALIEDLLDVSRVTRGLIELQRESVGMDAVVADAVEQVTPLMQARRHFLTVQAPPEPAVVSGDYNRLVQILANILTNAAKYSRDGGHIELTTELAGDDVVVSVKDDGMGMTPDLIAHLFEPFVQARRTADRSSGGLGLGLTLAKRLVELHGGTIACASPGLEQGSEFRVRLPRLPSGAEPPPRGNAGTAEQRQPPLDSRHLHILVVDDNVDAAQTLRLALESAGHHVDVAHGARQALDVAGRQRPDACVLDIGLPDMDGNALARQLRALPGTANATLVALTGYGQAADRDQALAAGFDFHVTKPVATDAILALVHTRHPGPGTDELNADKLSAGK